ncbi:hypothetical protein ACQY0O_007513 [Thecaphora frezii]
MLGRIFDDDAALLSTPLVREEGVACAALRLTLYQFLQRLQRQVSRTRFHCVNLAAESTQELRIRSTTAQQLEGTPSAMGRDTELGRDTPGPRIERIAVTMKRRSASQMVSRPGVTEVCQRSIRVTVEAGE